MEELRIAFASKISSDLDHIQRLFETMDSPSKSDLVVENFGNIIHALKGTAPMVGIINMEQFITVIERVFDAIKKKHLMLNAAIKEQTLLLIPIIKEGLSTDKKLDITHPKVNGVLQFFDSLISKNASA